MSLSPWYYKTETISTYDFAKRVCGQRCGSDAFARFNAIKYITRYNCKGVALEDLNKAQWYLNQLYNDIESTSNPFLWSVIKWIAHFVKIERIPVDPWVQEYQRYFATGENPHTNFDITEGKYIAKILGILSTTYYFDSYYKQSQLHNINDARKILEKLIAYVKGKTKNETLSKESESESKSES